MNEENMHSRKPTGKNKINLCIFSFFFLWHNLNNKWMSLHKWILKPNDHLHHNHCMFFYILVSKEKVFRKFCFIIKLFNRHDFHQKFALFSSMKSQFSKKNNNQQQIHIKWFIKLNCIHKYDTTVKILITLRDEN